MSSTCSANTSKNFSRRARPRPEFSRARQQLLQPLRAAAAIAPPPHHRTAAPSHHRFRNLAAATATTAAATTTTTMRATLTALADELRRLKADGVTTVAVSDESIAALRRLVRASAPASPAAASPVTASSATVPSAATPADARPSPSPPSAAAAPEARTYSQLREPAKRPAPPPPAPKLPPPPAVTLPEGGKQTRWDALHALVLNDPVCRKHVRPGKKIVLGTGSLDAGIFFCGEAPGQEEEIQGEPFVGPAGQLLTKMIQGMGLARGDVYIGNIMNWRPEIPAGPGGVQYGNRPPTAEEMAYCLPYLRAQLDIVRPEVIVALGSTAAQGLLGAGSFKTLGEVRGRWMQFFGTPVMVTYHPSYVLRQEEHGKKMANRTKRAVWEDLLKVMEHEKIALPVSEKQRNYYLPR
ncbi:MAG: uracil-DNA glycosylase [Opitutaceae bacterium]|nr:uracil-DNA glycosylase [Opitutaceae bacterium]